MTEDFHPPSIRDYLRVLRAQAWVILAVVVTAAGVALFLSLRQESRYEASASVSFEDSASNLGLIGQGAGQAQPTPSQTPQARAQTIKKPATLKRAMRRLGLDGVDPSRSEVEDAITTVLDTGSFLVQVTATWSDPQFAAQLANAFARTAVERVNNDEREEFRVQLRDVIEQQQSLGNSPAELAELGALIEPEQRLRFLSNNAAPANLAQPAEPPSDRASPQTVRNTLLGVIVGLALGLLAAFLRNSLDRRLRGVREIQEELPYPLVGHVRSEVMGKVVKANGGIDERLEDDLEAIRILRQNLEFLDVDAPLRSIMVTSAMPDEGKSTVAASLAFAAASLGRSTLLVDCDLRRPAIAERVGLSPAPGLTDYLSRRAAPSEIMHVIDAGAALRPTTNGSTPATDLVKPLVCITAGNPSIQPAELLESERFRDFIGSVGEVYDTVIIDTGPLLPVADTLSLLPLVDIILLCVRSGQTTRDQVHAARAVLDRVPHRPTGLVVTGLKRPEAADYGYYSYGEAYRRAPARAADEVEEAALRS